MADELLGEGKHLLLGQAGTGKTTCLASQVRLIVEGRANGSSAVVVCSLTRAAAAVIAGRDLPIPSRNVGTLHAHAYRSLGFPEVAEGHVDEWNERVPSLRLSDTSMLDTNDFPCEEPAQRTRGDERHQRYGLLRVNMVPRDRWPSLVTDFAEQWETWKSECGYIDFADMIEQALERVPHAPGCPAVLIVDEAQDLARTELALCHKWGEAAGAVIYAADPFQALYEWRGADPSHFTSGAIPPDRTRVLDQSYRVPESVRQTAVNWLQRLRHYTPVVYRARLSDPNDPSSIVSGQVTRSIGTWKHPEFAVRAAIEDVEAGRSVMIAATCSYMLRPTVALLLKSGVPFSNPWRTKRGDWNPLRAGARIPSLPERLLAFLRPSDTVYDPCSPDPEQRPRSWSWADLRTWADLLRECTFARLDPRPFLKAQVRNVSESVGHADLQGLFGEATAGQLTGLFAPGADPLRALQWLQDRMLPGRAKTARYPARVARVYGPRALSQKPMLHVGTVHSYKGGEADVVYLFPDISASANRVWARGGAGRDAVIRTFYVGMTRAREQLVLCGAGSRMAVRIVPVQRHGRR